jgi:hypothetical protein
MLLKKHERSAGLMAYTLVAIAIPIVLKSGHTKIIGSYEAAICNPWFSSFKVPAVSSQVLR